MLESFDVVAFQAVAAQPIEVVAAEFLVLAPVLEHVICDDEDGVRDRHGGAFDSTSGGQATELSDEVGVLRMTRAPGRLT